MARASSASRDRDKRAGAAIAGWFLLVLALPRVVRLLYPEVWVEDDFYLESAYLVSIGMRPYLDFVHPHMPVLEWFTAGWITLLGASHFSLEVLNETAIYATSVLTCKLAYKAAGRRTAICAAILYAFASLVFRYHVYERECFVGVLAAGAALAAMRDDLGTAAQAAIQAALFTAACAIKLTAVVPAAAVLCFLAIVRRRWPDAILAGLGVAAGVAALSAVLYWHYGFEFVFQTFIFHFMKGRVPGWVVVNRARALLDVLAPLFILGIIRIATEGRPSPAIWLTLMLVAFNYVFFGLLSPTSWGHNYVDFLPYVAIVAGLGLDRALGALREALNGPASGKRRQWSYVGASLALSAVCLYAFAPLINENWLRGSIYGFGFVPRDELRTLSEGLRRASAPDEEVIAPAFLCFEANRRELIRYPETYGVYREAEEEFRKDGFSKARENLGRADFFDLIHSTARYWTAPIRQAIDDGKVNAIIPDSPVQLLPLVSPTPDELAARGFVPYVRTDHFVLWRRIRR